jgi:hypothetical protein
MYAQHESMGFVGSGFTLRASMWSMNMQCERLLAMFIGVSQMVRFVSPKNSCAAAQSIVNIGLQRWTMIQQSTLAWRNANARRLEDELKPSVHDV